ncbi:endonuclease domain-containing protein [Agrococcus sp. Ld7]|uniref:endonuclease domain-containing protein n=1 Tax=Agrococcus sp. Ld7 TaxID=649148 RepID=UPI003863E2BF
MVRHAPLPEPLASGPFSVARAREEGVTARRLRGTDLVAPFHGVRAPCLATDVQALADAYRQRMRPGHVFAGITAARLWGLPVSTFWSRAEPLTIGIPAGTTRTRARGVVTHEFDATRLTSTELDGLPILDPLSTTMMLARETGGDDLVTLLDALITPSPIYHGLRLPVRPYTSVSALQAFAEQCHGLRGASAFLPAIDRARTGAESPPETRSRLEIVAAGLPEPVVQFEVWRQGTLQAVIDLAYPEWMIAIEYEGEHHLTDPVQWAKDIRRQELLESLGWIVIRVTKNDLRHGARGLVHRVRSALARRGVSV